MHVNKQINSILLYFTFCRRANSTGTEKVRSKLAFVTLVAQVSPSSNLEEGFELAFNGLESKKGQDIFESHEYSHYYFTTPNGTFNYTEVKGRQTYLPDEILTIVISTVENSTYTVNSVDIEVSEKCTRNSLTRYIVSSFERTSFSRWGISQKDYR